MKTRQSFIAVLAVVLASAVPAPAIAGGNFLEWGKGTAGVIVFGGAACAISNVVFGQGLALCTPTQLQYGRPIQQQEAYLLPQQHPYYRSAPHIATPVVATEPLPDCSTVSVDTLCEGRQYGTTRTVGNPVCPRQGVPRPVYTDFDYLGRPIHTNWKCDPPRRTTR